MSSKLRMPIYFLLCFLSLFSIIHAQGNSNTPTATQAATQSATPTATNPNTNRNSQSASNTASNGASSTFSGSALPPSSVSVDPVDPPGGFSMLTPAATDASSTFYKIGNTVTLSWTYTSVQVTPTGVDVQAYCSLNKFYYPVAQNISFNETQILWDTEAYDANATVPLITAMYTLYIFDDSRPVTAIPSAGVLGGFVGYVFGMYQPQSYTPLPTTSCVICSGGNQLLPKSSFLIGIVLALALGGLRVVM